MVVFQRALRELKEVTMSSVSVGNTNTTHVCNAEIRPQRATKYSKKSGSVAKIEHQAGVCKHCCMLLDKSVEERGKKEDHNEGLGNCVY
eukprot:scaffold7346_cov154-Skeletonema_menzelii.AAC.9